MEKDRLLLHLLTDYAKSDRYPFHMPGHKRRQSAFPDVFSIDITEIDGFDNLHHPEGILKESMEWAARVYGSDKTYYLINGSSCGILSAVSAAVRPGGRILMSRNCHKSAYHGVILNQLKTTYIYPQIIREMGIQGGISPSDVEKLLEENQDIEAVLIVSPTYDGVVSDIGRIADIVHKRKIPLIVDEAHGAHFAFADDKCGARNFPVSALDCGADMVIQSLHKTLPSLTQTAVLHVRRGYVNIERLERYLQMYQSSSPSYIFMASIENCIFDMEQYGKQRLDKFSERVRRLREELAGMKTIRLLDRNQCGQFAVFDVDESKLVISVRECMYCDSAGRWVPADGVWLAGQLREKYHLEMEMAEADYVTAILTFQDTQEGLDRLKDALLELDNILKKSDDFMTVGRRYPKDTDEAAWPAVRSVLTLAEAVNAEWEICPLEACENRISAEFIYLYPPGIPIVAPGEVMTDDIIKKVMCDKATGLPVQGMADPKAACLRVLKP